MTPPPRPIVLILGPTAGGKTALSLALAERLPCGSECICCDSMQVYRGLDIGTAKPTHAERSRAPHHLFDIADPAASDFSVDGWLELAEQVIDDIRARRRWPIVVGGTNLFVQALLFGLFDGPAPDEQLRSQLEQLSDADLRTRLIAADPAAYERIHPNDRKRTIRAIEVFHATGRPISEQQTQWEGQCPRTDVFIVGLNYSVEVINRRINARVKAMMAAGLLEEVRRLHEASLLGPRAREALGYKQLLEHLQGRWTLEEAVERIKIHTRRYAKQQRTWLRRFHILHPSVWIEADGIDSQVIADKAFTIINDRHF